MGQFWAEHWIELLFVFLGLVVSTSFTLGWNNMLNTKKKRNDIRLNEEKALIEKVLIEVNEKLKGICAEATLLHDTLIASLRRNFRKDCKRYLNRGYVTIEELSELQGEFGLYHSLGGNGRCEELYNKVLTLSVTKTHKDDEEIFIND